MKILNDIIKKTNYYTDPLFWDKKLGPNLSYNFASKCTKFNETISLDLMRNLRLLRLRRLLKHAYQNIPIYSYSYQKHGVRPQDIKQENDLHLLPTVDKSIFKEFSQNDGDHAKDLLGARKKLGVTSGSTGEPFRYFVDARHGIEKLACRNRFWQWAKADPDALKIFCAPASARHLYPKMTLFHPHYIQSKKSEYIKTIRALQAKFIFGQPLLTFDLLWMLKENGVDDVFFEKAILGGHAVSTGIRSFLKEHFRCEVFEFYASGEIGMMAAECEMHYGLHIVEENLIIEIIDNDGTVVPEGTIGNIVVTSLSNDIMPFIRYDIGDRGVILPSKCSCGRSLRRLLVEGRSDEVLLMAANGDSISPSVLRDILDPYFTYFHRYQVVQDDFSLLTINVIPTRRYHDKIAVQVISRVKNNIGCPMNVILKCVNFIPPFPGGKFKYFVSRLWKKKFPDVMFVTKSLEETILAV